MSINSGLFAGVAAVAAQSTAFAVISDNIANVNTVGFKFDNAVSSIGNTEPFDIGNSRWC